MQEYAEIDQLGVDLSIYPNRVESDRAMVALRAFTFFVVRDEVPNIQAMKRAMTGRC
jgi:hypothetical protein